MALNPWLLGRHATAVLVRIQSLNEATGALADEGGGSPGIDDIANLAAAGVVDEIRLTSGQETDNISPINSQFAHHVPIKVGYSMTVSEVMRSAVDACLLTNIWILGATNYATFTFTRGQHTWSGTFLMTSYNETIQRGKNVAHLTLSPVDNADIAYT